MCLIIAKPKGCEYDEIIPETIKRSSLSNRDGMGFAYKRDGETYIIMKKGYFVVDDIIKALEEAKIQSNDELIIHLRMCTHGKVLPENCHPFVVHPDHERIVQLEGDIRFPVMAHNGVFAGYYKHGSDFSDTYQFVADFLGQKNVLAATNHLLKYKPRLASDIFSNSRVAILMPHDTMKLYGYWNEDAETGIQFSSGMYHSRTNTSTGSACSVGRHFGSEDSRNFPYQGLAWSRKDEADKKTEEETETTRPYAYGYEGSFN